MGFHKCYLSLFNCVLLPFMQMTAWEPCGHVCWCWRPYCRHVRLWRHVRLSASAFRKLRWEFLWRLYVLFLRYFFFSFAFKGLPFAKFIFCFPLMFIHYFLPLFFPSITLSSTFSFITFILSRLSNSLSFTYT